MAAAKLLREQSPAASFHYLSGGSAGLKSRWMWARVKAEAERDLMEAYDAVCWRPAMIGGTAGRAAAVLSRGRFGPCSHVVFRPFQSLYIESDDIGRAMLEATRQGLRRRIFENAEMRDLAKRPDPSIPDP